MDGTEGGLQHLDLLLNEAVGLVVVGRRGIVLNLLVLQKLLKLFQGERWSVVGVEVLGGPYLAINSWIFWMRDWADLVVIL